MNNRKAVSFRSLCSDPVYREDEFTHWQVLKRETELYETKPLRRFHARFTLQA